MGAQIRDDQKKNAHLAQFLTYLFGAVNNDEIWSTSVELFSKMDANNMSQTLAIFEMLALFLPFYAAKAQETGVHLSFEGVNYEISLSGESYIAYIQSLYRVYPFYHQIDKDTLSSLLASLLLYHGLAVIEEGKTFEEFVQRIRPALG